VAGNAGKEVKRAIIMTDAGRWSIKLAKWWFEVALNQFNRPVRFTAGRENFASIVPELDSDNGGH
jgi:hypothetical protein